MMRCNSFARSAGFAALAALSWFPWVLVAAPFCGVRNARAFYLAGVAVLYVAGLSPRRTLWLTTAIVTALVTGGLTVVSASTTELSIGLALLLGVVRSVFLYRAAPARAVTTEAILLLGGLLLAAFLTGPSLPSTGLAVWGFLLVQSLFFLVGGVRPRPAGGQDPDAFEEAHRRAVALLERVGV